MSKILIHIIYWLIIAGASYLSYRIGKWSARKAIKQLELLKAELEKKSRPVPLFKLGLINPEVGKISLRIVNAAKETIILNNIEVHTKSYYVNPEMRDNPVAKQYKPFEFGKYSLLPEKTISIEFALDPIKYFDNVDFTANFKTSKNKAHWVKYRLNSSDHSLKLVDSR